MNLYSAKSSVQIIILLGGNMKNPILGKQTEFIHGRTFCKSWD
jgi:hypothetical protein